MFATRVPVLLLLFASALPTWAQPLVDDRKITLTTADAVTARRLALIKYIWGPAGFPLGELPTRTANIPSPVDGLADLRRVDELRVDMEAGEFGIAYHFIANQPNNRVVVLQNGHGCSFNEPPETPGHPSVGLRRAIAEFLTNGFSVLAVFMPRGSPHDCRYRTHDEMFRIQVSSGNPIKFFLEPTAVFLNYLAQRSQSDDFPSYGEYNMVGLSGGGWATTLYAAIDPTIVSSFSVAGSLPLYLRTGSSIGDREQTDAPLYKLAGYPDLYVMGSAGQGRREVQILNRRDSCCFGAAQYDSAAKGASYDDALHSYASRVQQAVTQIGSGEFRLVIDESADRHMFSRNALVNIVLADLAAG